MPTLVDTRTCLQLTTLECGTGVLNQRYYGGARVCCKARNVQAMYRFRENVLDLIHKRIRMGTCEVWGAVCCMLCTVQMTRKPDSWPTANRRNIPKMFWTARSAIRLQCTNPSQLPPYA